MIFYTEKVSGNTLTIKRSKNSENNKFAKLFIKPNCKYKIKKIQKNGNWTPVFNSDEYYVNATDQKIEFNKLENHSESVTPAEVKSSNIEDTFKYTLTQETVHNSKPEIRIPHENFTQNIENSSIKCDNQIYDQTTSNFYNIEKYTGEPKYALIHENSKTDPNSEFLIPNDENFVKSSMKTSFNNTKKWVTFNEIIENECEHNFTDELYDDNLIVFSKNEAESSNTENVNSHLKFPINNSSNSSQSTTTDQQKLKDMIKQVQRMK